MSSMDRWYAARLQGRTPCYIRSMLENPAICLRTISRLSARESALITARGVGTRGSLPAGDRVRALVTIAAILQSQRARYALIGGVAVGLHSGVPRATVGTDLAVCTSSRGPVLRAALVAGGLQFRGEHPHSENYRHPGGEPLQLAFDEAFDPMIERAEEFLLDGIAIRVVTRPDLIAMKQRAAADPGRRRSKALRDRADIALLQGDVPGPDEGW